MPYIRISYEAAILRPHAVEPLVQTQVACLVSSSGNRLCFQWDSTEQDRQCWSDVVKFVASSSSEFHNLHQGLGRKSLISLEVLRVGNMVPNPISHVIEFYVFMWIPSALG